MQTSQNEYEGLVVKRQFGAGSKSDREAVILETGDESLVLRREGGNAFSDHDLDALVGCRIRGVGRRAGYTFIMSSWRNIGLEARKTPEKWK